MHYYQLSYSADNTTIPLLPNFYFINYILSLNFCIICELANLSTLNLNYHCQLSLMSQIAIQRGKLDFISKFQDNHQSNKQLKIFHFESYFYIYDRLISNKVLFNIDAVLNFVFFQDFQATIRPIVFHILKYLVQNYFYFYFLSLFSKFILQMTKEEKLMNYAINLNKNIIQILIDLIKKECLYVLKSQLPIQKFTIKLTIQSFIRCILLRQFSIYVIQQKSVININHYFNNLYLLIDNSKAMIPPRLRQREKQDFNVLSFDGQLNDHPEQGEEFKNQYSTFIEELEQTTQKLMNQVFNTQYKPQINFDQSDHEDSKDKKGKGKYNVIENKRYNKISSAGTKPKGHYKTGIATRDFQTPVQGTQSFKNFIARNNRWTERKSDYIKKQVEKKEYQQKKQMTLIPQILRGSIQKLQPIYDRALEIHASIEKKRAFKKIQEKKKEDEQINRYPFHPEIISKNKTRTLQEYLKDKEEWEKKKKEGREIRKLKQQASKYSQCTFAPQLISKQIQEHSSRLKPGEKVEERLLRSLQKVFIQI